MLLVLALPILVLSLTTELVIIGPEDPLLGILLPDLLLTVVAALSLRRPSVLLLAPAFPLLRLVDAAVCLTSMVRAWAVQSAGAWVSPARRPLAVLEGAAVESA